MKGQLSYLRVCGERGVASHEEVEVRGGDEGGDETDEVIVHVGGVAQGGCGDGHDGGHKRVYLAEGGVLYVQSVGGYPVEGRVVKHHHAVCALSQPLEGEDAVVGLNNHVTYLLLVREH